MSSPANKADLIAQVQARTGLNASQAKAATQAVIDSIRDLTFAHNELQLRGFGKFDLRHRAGRAGNGSVGPSSPRDYVKFTAGSSCKAAAQ